MNKPYDNSPDNSNDVLDIYIFRILNMCVSVHATINSNFSQKS